MGEQRVADQPFIPCDESNQPFSVDIWCFLWTYGREASLPLSLSDPLLFIGHACQEFIKGQP